MNKERRYVLSAWLFTTVEGSGEKPSFSFLLGILEWASAPVLKVNFSIVRCQRWGSLRRGITLYLEFLTEYADLVAMRCAVFPPTLYTEEAISDSLI